MKKFTVIQQPIKLNFDMTKKIHIFGASGSGATTLGKNLSLHFGIPFLDADDYYWKNTNLPFQEPNPLEIRKSLLKSALLNYSDWIISGSLTSWGDEIKDEFSCAIYLYVPQEERIRRIKKREQERFNHRVELGGDMYEAHCKFIEWSKQYDEGTLSGRSKPIHEAWMKTLKCLLVRIEGNLNEDQVLKEAIKTLNQV